MKNQTTREQQQTLLAKLPEPLQSQNQSRVFEADARRSEAELPETGQSEVSRELNHANCNRDRFSTLQDAIEFLEEKCGFVVVQVEIVPALWKVASLNGRFRATLGCSELIGFAVSEFELAQRLSPGFESDGIKGMVAGLSEMCDFDNRQSNLAGSELKNLSSQTAGVKSSMAKVSGKSSGSCSVQMEQLGTCGLACLDNCPAHRNQHKEVRQ